MAERAHVKRAASRQNDAYVMAVREGKTTTGNAVSRRGEAYPNPTTHTNYAIFYIFSKMSLEAF